MIYTPFEQNFALSYKKWCEPPHAPYEFEIRIIPLTRENKIYYISYARDWINPAPGCNGEVVDAGTFVIAEKTGKTGLYEIKSRFEETNFYRAMVLTGKINEMVVIDRNNYGWSGALETEFDPISKTNGEILFNTRLSVCDPGGPCYHRMYLYWVYGRDKKLRCLYYLDRYELVQDPQTGKLKPMGQKIELAP